MVVNQYETWPPYRAATAAKGRLYKVLGPVLTVVGTLLVAAFVGVVIAAFFVLLLDAAVGSPPSWVFLFVWVALTALALYVIWGER